MEYLESLMIKESKTCLRRYIANGRLRVNGYAVNSSVTLSEGDILSFPDDIDMSPPPPPRSVPDKDVRVIFEDEDHVVIDKSAGVAVSPVHEKSRPQLYDWLLMYLNRESPAGGPYVRPHIVHRLDRETSGILLVAKHSKAAKALSMQFQKRTIKKEYLGLVEGVFPKKTYKASIPVIKQKKGEIAMVPSEKGKEAVTEIQIVKSYKKFTLLKLRPQTGRQHQLRVHLKALGYPLAVDFLYGYRERLDQNMIDSFYNYTQQHKEGEKLRNGVLLERTPLHACRITYKLPSCGAFTSQTSSLPLDFENVLNYIEKRDGR